MKSHDLIFVNDAGGVHCSQCDQYWGRMDPISAVCKPKPVLIDQHEREGMEGFSYAETPDSVADQEPEDRHPADMDGHWTDEPIWPNEGYFEGDTPGFKWEDLPHNPCGDLLIENPTFKHNTDGWIGSANQYAPETFDNQDEPIMMAVDPGVDTPPSFFFTTRSKPFNFDRFIIDDNGSEIPFTWTWTAPAPEPEVPLWKRNRDAMDARFERRRQEAETRDDSGDKLDVAEKDFAAVIQAFKIFKEYLEKSAVSWDEFITAYDNLPDIEEN